MRRSMLLGISLVGGLLFGAMFTSSPALGDEVTHHVPRCSAPCPNVICGGTKPCKCDKLGSQHVCLQGNGEVDPPVDP